ncbi:retrovirus-related pol polyprotein from transposon TNT 1-94 [Tanacetum coccineum]
MSQDVMLCVMTSTTVFGDSVNLEMKKSKTCNKCLDLESELVKKKNIVQRDDKSCENQNAPEFSKYFENNDLKAQLQEKDTKINKLRNHIKSLRESDKKDKVKQDMDEIETINIEHSVAKLIFEKHYDSLIAQLNSKSMENADLKGQIQEKCIFDANHDMCVLDFGKDVNVHSTSKFTSTKVVPFKETTSKSVETQQSDIKVYSRRPKPIKSVGSSSKSKIIESRISNTSEPNQSWGSNASDIPSSSSLVNFRFSNDQIAKIMSYGDYQLGNVTITWVYYVEGLGNSKKHSLKPKSEDSIQEKLYLLHMDFCGPMRIQSINGRKYILVIVDDYSRFISGPKPQQMTLGTLSSGLVPNPLSSTPYVPPTKND